MIDFAGLQSAVKTKLDEDRGIHLIDAEGPNLEAAVNEAAALLDAPVRNLEYEVVLLKTSFLGIGENICKIRAFERPQLKKTRLEADVEIEEIDDFGDLELLSDKDGEVFIQRLPDGIFIKVVTPEGDGKRATMDDANRALHRAGIISGSDENIVKAAVKTAKGEYVRIGDYIYNIVNDTSVQVEITDSEMRCYITVIPPKPGGCDLNFESYMSILSQHMVSFGINEPFLRELADKPLYRKRVCVAMGKKPVDGMDSYLEYYFETDQAKVRFIADNKTGKVNLKELNLIQNVTKDQKLAKKNDAEAGVEGCTVTGKALPACSGKDCTVQLGKNVRLAEDKHTILADINGQVVFANSKISVERVYFVDGSVDLKTGNITFLGNVIIAGNVEEGFSVRAAGNIEVHGMVAKASLDAGGELIVNAGITGKEGVLIRAGGSVWAKFIENAAIDAGDSVIVTDGIINTTITASKRIVCQGKRASVIGGHLLAGEEIFAKEIGSPAGGVATLCEVGYDPKSKLKISQLEQKKIDARTELEDVQFNIQTLNSIKKQRGALPEDKEEYLNDLNKKCTEIEMAIDGIDIEIAEIKDSLDKIKVDGKVTATKFFRGVTIGIRDKSDTLATEYRSVTFVLKDDFVQAKPYADKSSKKR